MKIEEVLNELKKEERKFDQTIDLIVNLKGINLKRDQVNIVASLPHKFKDKKVCGFLTGKSNLVHTISEPEFFAYNDKKVLKNLVKKYDFFIASASLMPKVASVFGKILGPVGKMPSPQLGLIMQENEKNIKDALDKIATSVKIRLKEASIKLAIGKLSMKNEDVKTNFESVYRAIENALPKKKENVKNVMLKTSMGKPLKVEVA